MNTYYFSIIGNLIRKNRKKANLTIEELANLSGISKDKISKIEDGEITTPNFKTIQKLANTLAIPYRDIVKFFLMEEQSPAVLMDMLQQAVKDAPEFCVDISLRFLNDECKPRGELVQELFKFTNTVKDYGIKLELYKKIVEYTDYYGVYDYYAKALFQQYLIERDDFSRLRETYIIGKSVSKYVNFLSLEEKITFHSKLGTHAYHLCKYEEAIQILSETLDVESTEIKANAVLLLSSAYCCIGNIVEAEKYLQLSQACDLPSSKENINLIQGRINAKKGKIDIAIEQLSQCLETAFNKINIVNILFDLYLEKKQFVDIENLIKREDEFIDPEPKHPNWTILQAMYYEKVGSYYSSVDLLKESIYSLLKSASYYAKVDRNKEVYHCLQMILHPFTDIKNQDSNSLEIMKDVVNFIDYVKLPVKKNQNTLDKGGNIR